MDNRTKRFRKGRQRPLFLLDQDAEEKDDQDDLQDYGAEDAHDPENTGESDWDSLAFEQRKSFSPCTTSFCKEKNIAHTHSTEDRCYKLHPQNGKGGKGSVKGSNSLLFIKGGKGSPKGKGKTKEKAKESLESRQDKTRQDNKIRFSFVFVPLCCESSYICIKVRSRIVCNRQDSHQVGPPNYRL